MAAGDRMSLDQVLSDPWYVLDRTDGRTKVALIVEVDGEEYVLMMEPVIADALGRAFEGKRS